MLSYVQSRGTVAGGVRLAMAVVLAGAAGCGLVLDNDPPDTKDGAVRDGGHGNMDGSVVEDGSTGEDGAITGDGSTGGDGAVAVDASRVDGSVPCPDGCDDFNACTFDFCTTEGRCAHDLISVCSTNATCDPETGECTCDLGFTRCGDFCIPSENWECTPGTSDELECGGCGERSCNAECQWGDCKAFAGNTCGELGETSCNTSTGFCQICSQECTLVSTDAATCSSDTDCEAVTVPL